MKFTPEEAEAYARSGPPSQYSNGGDGNSRADDDNSRDNSANAHLRPAPLDPDDFSFHPLASSHRFHGHWSAGPLTLNLATKDANQNIAIKQIDAIEMQKREATWRQARPEQPNKPNKQHSSNVSAASAFGGFGVFQTDQSNGYATRTNGLAITPAQSVGAAAVGNYPSSLYSPAAVSGYHSTAGLMGIGGAAAAVGLSSGLDSHIPEGSEHSLHRADHEQLPDGRRRQSRSQSQSQSLSAAHAEAEEEPQEEEQTSQQLENEHEENNKQQHTHDTYHTQQQAIDQEQVAPIEIILDPELDKPTEAADSTLAIDIDPSPPVVVHIDAGESAEQPAASEEPPSSVMIEDSPMVPHSAAVLASPTSDQSEP